MAGTTRKKWLGFVAARWRINSSRCSPPRVWFATTKYFRMAHLLPSRRMSPEVFPKDTARTAGEMAVTC